MSEDAQKDWIKRVLGVSVGASAGREQDRVAARKAAGKKCLETWLEAKETADDGLSRLQAALKNTDDPAMQRIADGGLHAVSRGVQVGIRIALAEFAGGTDATEKAAEKLLASVAQFRQFLTTDPAVQLCDENPFDIDVSLRPVLGGALNEVERQVKTLSK